MMKFMFMDQETRGTETVPKVTQLVNGIADFGSGNLPQLYVLFNH